MDFDPDSDPEAAAMAAAMGFSSFGSHKPPAKKRKFNASTDAFVEGQDLEKLDRGGKKGGGSGGNTVPLGKMRVIGQGKGKEKRNEEEIELDLDDEEEGPRYEDTSRTPPREAIPGPGPGSLNGEEEEGPRYEDTSLPPPILASSLTAPGHEKDTTTSPEALEMQQRIDALLSSIQPASPPSSTRSFPIPPPPPGSYIHPSPLPPPPGIHLPARPATNYAPPSLGQNYPSSHSRRAPSEASTNSRPRGRGERNEKWYLGYYDPSFNENPWRELEVKNGLEEVGTWVERGKR